MRELKLPGVEAVSQTESNEEDNEGTNDKVVADEMEEIEQQQKMNEIVANIPEEFDVDGRTIKVHSKSAREMVRIDKAIMKILKVQYERETMEVAEDDGFWDRLDDLQELYYSTTFDVLSLIINKDPDKPEFSKDWIMDNIDLMDDGIGEKILDAYNTKCSAQNFFQKVLRSRKF